jgi:SAM-dependent methyltransferase
VADRVRPGRLSEATTTTVLSPEWGPSEIADDDIRLLCELRGNSREDVVARLASYDPDEMARAWRAAAPATPSDVLAFYAETDLYLYEQLVWHGSSHYVPYLRRLEWLAELWPPGVHPRALDFGGGIGTTAIRLAEFGYRVSLAEVPGPTLDFARARLERRGLEAEIVPVTGTRPRLAGGAWHVLVYYDVVEHLAEPESWTRGLLRALPSGGGAAIIAGFTEQHDRYPHHLAVGEERLGGYRWDAFLRGLGLREVRNGLYLKRPAPVRAWARVRYLLWRALEGARRAR